MDGVSLKKSQIKDQGTITYRFDPAAKPFSCGRRPNSSHRIGVSSLSRMTAGG